MSELSGLELRKAACEALGITHPHTVNHDEQQAEQSDPCVLCGIARHSHHKGMPAIESDPAVSESMFLEWCAKEGYESSLWIDRESCEVSLFKEGADVDEGYALIAKVGSTPSEARARCIVAASQAKGQK